MGKTGRFARNQQEPHSPRDRSQHMGCELPICMNERMSGSALRCNILGQTVPTVPATAVRLRVMLSPASYGSYGQSPVLSMPSLRLVRGADRFQTVPAARASVAPPTAVELRVMLPPASYGQSPVLPILRLMHEAYCGQTIPAARASACVVPDHRCAHHYRPHASWWRE